MGRVTFYIDGFNFYYGIKRSAKADKKWNNAYWIDLVKLCSGLISQDDTLEKVVYFTAAPLSTGKSQRQGAFLNANKALNGDKFEVIRGKYLEKHIECPFNPDVEENQDPEGTICRNFLREQIAAVLKTELS